MDTDAKAYASKLRQTPPVPCDLKVGDKVTYTNDAGVQFPDMRVIGFADDDSFYGRFVHIVGPVHDGAFWFPHIPSELSKATGATA